jgi:hypothetical protein
VSVLAIALPIKLWCSSTVTRTGTLTNKLRKTACLHVNMRMRTQRIEQYYDYYIKMPRLDK